MRWWLNLTALALMAPVGAGCGKSTSSGGAADGSQASADDSPDKAVHDFLSAAQAGDQKRLSSLLTTAAQTEAQKNGVNFELDSYQNASFQLEQYEFLNEAKDSAHVSCKWTDRYQDGTEVTHDVIWVVRHEAAGWRVAGMIIRPFPDKPPVALNYEDFKALADAKDFIEQEAMRREKAAAPQQQPASTAEKPLTAQQLGPAQQFAPGATQNGATQNGPPTADQQPAGVQQTGLQQSVGPGTLPPQTAQRPGSQSLPPK